MTCDPSIQYNIIRYNTIQYSSIPYNIIQYNTIQYNTIPYNRNITIWYDKIYIQYNKIQNIRIQLYYIMLFSAAVGR